MNRKKEKRTSDVKAADNFALYSVQFLFTKAKGICIDGFSGNYSGYTVCQL